MSELRPPVFYRDARATAVLYAVPLTTALPFLDGTGLTAVSLAGSALVNAVWFDYGASSIGPYREFSLGIVASPSRLRLASIAPLLRGKAGDIGSFIVALPVNSEQARAGGVAIYGLPKTTLGIELNHTSSQLDAEVTDETRPICSMQVPLRLGIPTWVRELVIYSRLEAELLSASVTTNWLAQIDLVGRPRLSVANRTHPLGRIVTQLGLEQAPTLAIVHGKLRSATLKEPTRLGTVKPTIGR